jgi:dTDP-4-amino-4,6-dideoxygalactose transaminase
LVRAKLTEAGFGTRRYFYPALNRLPYVTGGAMPVAEDAASRVLCLPMFADLSVGDASRIADRLRTALLESA